MKLFFVLYQDVSSCDSPNNHGLRQKDIYSLLSIKSGGIQFQASFHSSEKSGLQVGISSILLSFPSGLSPQGSKMAAEIHALVLRLASQAEKRQYKQVLFCE